MERRITRLCDAGRARLIVELGPGTGGTTEALLGAMGANARLLGIEIDPEFAARVGRIDDARLVVHHGSAEHIGEALAAHALDAPDVVVSGIPFSTMPEALAGRIVREVERVLAPGGCFVAYQFRGHVARYSEAVFGRAERREMETLNVPPMRLWRWRVGRSERAPARPVGVAERRRELSDSRQPDIA